MKVTEIIHRSGFLGFLDLKTENFADSFFRTYC